MNILYVSHLHPPENELLKNIGGMQRVSMQLVKELEQKPGIGIRTELMHASWNMIGLKTAGFLLKELVRLPKLAREADIILFSSMVTAAIAPFIRRRIDIPMVTINHGQDVTLPFGPYQWFVPRIFSSLDGVISVSRATRQACIDRGMRPEKGVALPNGFDPDKLDQFPDKPTARRRLQERLGTDLEGRPLLLTVGRLVKRKGHEWFITHVLPKLDREAVYVAIGDGPELETVERAAEQSEEKNIHLMGRQPDAVLREAYAAADLFVMPNIPVEGDMEGFGIVMLEANMAQTPAVASDLEGIKDVITEGKNGYRIPAGDAEQFAEKVNVLLSESLEELSVNSRSWVIDRFSWSRVAEQYIEYLDEVVSRFQPVER